MRADPAESIAKTALRIAVNTNLTNETLKEKINTRIDSVNDFKLQELIDFIINIIQEYYMKTVELEHLLSPQVKEEKNASSVKNTEAKTEDHYAEDPDRW